MIINKVSPGNGGSEPVRLLGFGFTAMRLLRALHEQATGPLAALLVDHPVWREPDDIKQTVRTFELEGIAFLFIAIGMDATDYEMGQAVMLAWRASEYGVATIAIAVHSANSRAMAVSDPGPFWPNRPAMLREFLLEMVDGRIDVEDDDFAQDLEPLRWLYGTLRGLAREGILILEPAWDLHDVAEVLDLPGSHLTLLTRCGLVGSSVLAAVEDGFQDLSAAGIDLELASGVLIIVWQPEPKRLGVHDISNIVRTAHAAMGRGCQQLVLTARVTMPKEKAREFGPTATLVVSRRTANLRPEDLP